MHANVTVGDTNAVIRLEGRFDFNAHRDFREAADTVLAGPATPIAVDFAGVDYVDSSALGMLLMLRDRARNAGRDVTLVACHGAVRQVLDIANFGKLFTIV